MSHLTSDEVSALEQGTLPDDRLDHIAECDDCAAQLAVVTETLAALPSPAMPAEVAERLDQVIAAESQRRTSGAAEREERLAQAAHAKRLSLGTFGDNSPAKEFAGKQLRRDRRRTTAG